MMAMRYGTVPIVHETGGLKDSVRQYKDFDGVGDGFSFADYQAKDLYLAIAEAVRLYFSSEDVFKTLRYRCMTKDFSWDKSAGEYKHMYDDISDIDGDGEYISFEDAYDYLKHCYEVNDRENKEKYPEAIREDYHRVIQIQIVGRGEGFMNVEFKGRAMIIEPKPRPDAEAFVVCSYDNLVAMARGLVTTDKLFLNGQLKLTGNLSKGFEIRKLLAPSK